MLTSNVNVRTKHSNIRLKDRRLWKRLWWALYVRSHLRRQKDALKRVAAFYQRLLTMVSIDDRPEIGRTQPRWGDPCVFMTMTAM